VHTALLYVKEKMIVSLNGHFPTSVAGMMAFAAAGTSSAVAWLRGRSDANVERIAAWVTFLEVFLFFDIVFKWRWMLHAAFIRLAMDHAEYERRRVVQVAALVVLSAILLGFGTFTARKLRDKISVTFALWSASLSLACWCVEVISLHYVDAVLYHRIAGVMVIVPIWLLLGFTTAISIQAARSQL
jgi:hypothetical protein